MIQIEGAENIIDYPRFIRINNKQAFLLQGFPDHHPSSIKYINFWRDEKRKCIEGLWAQDTNNHKDPGAYRWMPPNLYFYVNHGTILHRETKGEPFKKIRPYLRDVEWEFFYNWVECRGFSGFENDELYHCIRESQEPDFEPEHWMNKCKDKDGKINKRMYYNFFNEKDEPKEYRPARTYLRGLFDKSLGKALYSNEALNLFLLGSRGFGKSFMVGVGVILHEWIFDGLKYYESSLEQDQNKVEVFVGAALASKSSDLLQKTRQSFENLPGGWGKGTKYILPPFFKNIMGSLRPNNGNSPFRHEYEKKIGSSKIIAGSGSTIKHGIYTSENPEAAAGGRYTVMAIEEVGLLPNALTVHGSNEAAQTVGADVIGSSVYIGTGGNMEKIIESEIIFRDPGGFRFLEFENVYEPSDGSKIGWFVPAIYNINGLKDENGNTDIEATIAHYNKRREKARTARDKSALALEMMNYPLVPSEMFLNTGLNKFPVADLKMQLAHVVNSPNKYRNINAVGKLVINPDTKAIEFRSDPNLEEITKFPLKDNKGMDGAVVIREFPKTNDKGEIIQGRYLQGTDTYDDDESNTTSFGSSFILDSFTDRIVCEFFGRPSANEFYETVRRMNIFYRSLHNYEANKKGLFTYYRNKNSVHLLADTPESLRDVENVTISRVGNKSKGTNATKAINSYARELIENWLIDSAPANQDGEELQNLHNIWGEGLLKELIYWNSDANYDRVSSLGMLLIIRADRERIIENKRTGFEAADSIYEHSFWKRNYQTKDTMYNTKAIRNLRKLF